jgi:hypothetical protein
MIGGAFALPATADMNIRGMLPANACGGDWMMDGDVRVFDRENLFEHIDGEAELYLPYGFRMLAAAVYVNRKNHDDAVTVDVYEMGSPLDAFGIYSNYRREDHVPAGIGPGLLTEGFISPTQLMFYKDVYFVRIQASGGADLFRDALLNCGRTVARKIPPSSEPGRRPPILEALHVPGIIPGSERYIAQSLLGYEFFRRGLTAAAREGMQVFLMIGDTGAAAREAFDRYRSYLKASGGKNIRTGKKAGRLSLTAGDPLYGDVIVTESGRYLVGAVRIKNPSEARQITAAVLKKLRESPML